MLYKVVLFSLYRKVSPPDAHTDPLPVGSPQSPE